MNAVNLIPADRGRRSGSQSLTDSLPLLGVLTALLLALVATVLFVDAHNRVTARRAQLAHINASTARWQAASAKFAPDLAALKNRTSHIETAIALTGSRYDWSLLLSQLAGLMPKDTALTSLSATNESAAAAAAAESSGATASTGIAISACASSQDSVAAAMVALRKIVGVSEVSLSSSSSGDGSGSSSSSSSSGGGGCGSLPVTFQVNLTFAPPTEAAGVRLLGGSSTPTSSASGVAQ